MLLVSRAGTMVQSLYCRCRQFVPLIHDLLQVLLLLSSLLSSSGADEPGQRFREVPESVLAAEGSSVTLRCAVDHQQGRAQWTKDGFALGFERGVPGYPRYRYTGDSSVGEHYLVITGVTLQDDGEYQCQVGPTAVAAPIWASATVTVLVPPSGISIVGWRDDAVVELVEGSSVSLECRVLDARPAPSIAWYRDGLLIDSELQEDEEETGSHRRLVTLRSRLQVMATAEDDGQQFSCRGGHPALRDATAALVASVTLSVLHPPVSVAVSGWSESDIGKAGDVVSLSCRVTGGNPPPSISWTRRGLALKSAKAKSGPVKHEDSKNVGHLTRVIKSETELTLEAEDDGGTVQCQANSDMLEKPLKDNVTLAVMYGSRSVHITGPSSVTEEQRVGFLCTSAPANPPVTLRWSVNGEEVPKSDEVLVNKNSNGGWVSTLQLRNIRLGTYGVADVIVECTAVSKELGKTTFTSHLVSIVKPPGPPLLSHELHQIVPEGSIVPVICTSVGGNPPPTIVLSVGGQEVTSEILHKNGVTEARARVTARVSDNGAAVLCEVSGPAQTKAMTAVTRLNVAFSPSRISGVAEPVEVDEGQETTLICETSSSNPPSNITWRAEGRILLGDRQKFSSGEHGGKITGSQVRLSLKASDNGRVFGCTASNSITPPVTVNITTRVRHAPLWVEVPSELVDVHEGDDLLVTAEASANPGPIRYRWEHYGRLVSEVGPELHISRISREEAGTYSVSASSPRGTINTSFTLDILFPPEEVHVTKRVTVREGDVANVECIAKGNPKPRLYWSTQNSSYLEDKLAEGVGSARLVIKDVTRQSTGLYYCHAYNSLGTAVPVATALIVTQAVEIVTKRRGKGDYGGWAAEGGTGMLTCFARAAPRPTFVWSTEDGVTLAAPEKYIIHSTQLEDDLVLWSSRLEVRLVTMRDYGQYRCTAHNSLGAGTALYTLHPPMPPPTPNNLTVFNVTSDSIILAWSPGRHNRPAAYRNAFSEAQEDDRHTTDTGSDEQYSNVEVPANIPTLDIEYIAQVGDAVDAAAASQAISSAEGYIVQYRSELTGKHQVIEIAPGTSTFARLTGLQPGVTYSFVVAAANEQGTSLPTPPIAFKMPVDGSTRNMGIWRTPRLMLLIMVVTGSALLALNLVIIVCFLKKRSRSSSLSASSSKTTGIAIYPGTPASERDVNQELLTSAPFASLVQSGNLQAMEQTSDLSQPSLSPFQPSRSPIVSGHIHNSFKPISTISDTQENEITENKEIDANIICSVQEPEEILFNTDEPDECFRSVEVNDKLEPVSEVCPLSENCCGRRSPFLGDDKISVSSWHNFPTQCSHYRMQRNITPISHMNSPQSVSKLGCQNQALHSSSSAIHQQGHMHPLSYNRIPFVPHQPSSLPEQNTELSSNSHDCNFQQNPHTHCHKKHTLSFEMQSRPQQNSGPIMNRLDHRHHHFHQVHMQRSNINTMGPSVLCSPIRMSPTNNTQQNAYRLMHSPNSDIHRSFRVDNDQRNQFSLNYERSVQGANQVRPEIMTHINNAEKNQSSFSALNPADLCGYTSDTQDSRCCQPGQYQYYQTLGHRPRRCESPGQYSTMHRPHSRPQLSTHQEVCHTRAASALPDIQLQGVREHHMMSPQPRQMAHSPPRMLIRSFSVDDSSHSCPLNDPFRSLLEKPCSDYDNVSKYLLSEISSVNKDDSRRHSKTEEEIVQEHLKSISESLNLIEDNVCEPFPTHIQKSSEPRVTFNEPIAETKTFHDPRLDDDDDFDEDSNISSVGNHSSESNSIIYANNVIQNETSSFSKANTDLSTDQRDTRLSPNKPKASHMRSPPLPKFRSSSSTSSNASSSSSSTVAGHRFNASADRPSSNASDTSSNGSCSSAATVSLSTGKLALNFSALGNSSVRYKDNDLKSSAVQNLEQDSSIEFNNRCNT